MSIEDAVKQIMASRPTFKVGDRVRVRWNPECRLQGIEGSYAAKHGLRGHAQGEDGKTGTVIDVSEPDDALARQGHPYEVRLDEPYPLPSGKWAGWTQSSPTELEPLAAAADARRGEDS